MVEVERLLEWYSADGRLVGQAVMPTTQLTELQALFGVSTSDPMYDCWCVGPTQAGRLSVLAGVPIELDRFKYYVTAQAIAKS